MTSAARHPLASEYLERLERAARGLPGGWGAELVAAVDARLAEALGPDSSEADVRAVLERLGEPESVIAAAHEGHAAQQRRGAWMRTAIVLLWGAALAAVAGRLTGVY